MNQKAKPIVAIFRTASLAVTLAGAAGALGLMIYAGRPRDLGFFVSVSPFAAWLLTPYLLTGLAAWRCSSIFSGLLALVSSLGVGLLWKTLFIDRPDAQGALVFIAAPFWQLMFASPFALIALVLSQSERRNWHRRNE
jgi:hypothetical protein